MSRAEILAARKAFVAGAVYAGGFDLHGVAEIRARKDFPLPKVKRPRVVRVAGGLAEGVAYRVVNGRLQFREPRATSWLPSTYTVQMVGMLADLIKNPTEEVEDDGR